VGRTQGIGEEELRGVRAGSLRGSFSARERAALEYAAAIVAGHSVQDSVFQRVHALFSEEEIVELTATICFEICAAKFNRALEIEWESCPV